LFDRLRSIFGTNNGARPAKSDFMRPREEPVKAPVKAPVKEPEVVSYDMKGPLPIMEKPPTILLPGVTGAPVAVSKPMEEMKPMAPLPPDIDPNEVAIVKHDEKKSSGERFRYADKPLKPLYGGERRPDVIKYDDKRGGDVIKYKVAPVVPHANVEKHDKPAGEVFKYKPVRIEIKS
jgi:hypothetical protein